MAVNVGDQAPKFELVDGDLKFRSRTICKQGICREK